MTVRGPMHFSKSFIERPVATLLVMLTLITFGAYALSNLPVSVLPNTTANTISVSANYPGASPEQVATLVTGPLETQFLSIQGVESVNSSSTYQNSSILLKFHPTININDAATNTQQAISQVQGQLPPLPNLPSYTKVNPSDTPIMYIVVYSDTQDQSSIYDYANNIIARQLGTTEGVANVQVYGNPFAVRIHIDPESIAAKGITLADVSNAITQNNPVRPTGKFYGPNFTIITTADGQLFSADDYNNMIIKIQNDNVVRLTDIGRAFNSVQNTNQNIQWFNRGDSKGKEAVFIAILKQNNFNTVTVCSNLESKMLELTPSMPRSMKYDICFNQKNYVLESVKDIEMTLYLAFILVVIVVFLYLGKIRNSVIPLITLPITITGTFILMFFLGYNVDVMSLSAITLATGFLVDDAIIVLENIVRHGEEGMQPYKASIVGSKQIFTAIISISGCLCAVFIPMLYIPGLMGQLFSEMAGVMIAAILLSGFISVTLTPMLCSRFIPPYDPNKKSRVEELSIAFNEFFRKFYVPVLAWSLHHKRSILGLSFLLLITSVAITIKTPKEFLPDTPINAVIGYVVADESASPQKTEVFLKEIAKHTLSNPYVLGQCTVSDSPSDNMGIIFMILDDSKGSIPFDRVLQDFYVKSRSVLGCKVFFKPLPLINVQSGSSSAGRATFQYVVASQDEKIMEEKTKALMNAMRKEPEFFLVNSDLSVGSPVFSMHIDRDKARAYGNITPLNFENNLALAYGQTYVSTIYRPNSVNYVILELKNKFKQTPGEMDRLFLGPQVPGANVSPWGNMFSTTDTTSATNTTSLFKGTLKAEPNMINHYNSLPSSTISFNISTGYTISQALEKLAIIGPQVFEGKAVGFSSGASAEFQKAMVQLFILTGLAIFAIYIILGILYENFLHPITPISAVPLAAFGGLLTLYLLGFKLSIYAMIGIIMLMGIVMKNGILIVDFALEELEKNPQTTAEEAITKASMLRFRPILMTTFAAMMGAVPVALGIGGEIALSRAPLGVAIVGGLLFAQILSLVVAPVVFVYVYDYSKKITTRKGGLFYPYREDDHETNKE
jgi:HAE1 family hydrophobic/amphiphilic exporter-1